MTCDHSDALVLVERPNRRGEARVTWCPRCGAVKVAEVNTDRWIPPGEHAPSPAVLVDLRYQARITS